MIFYGNGGFIWHDLYNMPIKLREFYWRELLNAKEEESKALQKSPATNSNSRIRKR